ncbi:unnamed protein product, partial [Didymodactylos carnosus]
MTACNTTTTTIQPNDSEKVFYSDLDKYIDSLSVKFREKSVIKKKVCEDNVQALLLQKGRPRHPQSQGCIERANGVLCDALGKWLATNNSIHWSEGLLPVVYGINTRVSCVTKKTPYEVMFGQPPRSDSEFWKLVDQKNIDDEDDLPTPVADMD